MTHQHKGESLYVDSRTDEEREKDAKIEVTMTTTENDELLIIDANGVRVFTNQLK